MNFDITNRLQFSGGDSLLEIIYLIASVLFIAGLKMLSKPNSAKKGNFWAAAGMTIAIIATIALHRMDGEPIRNIGWIVLAIAIGTLMGWMVALKVKMTAMPQLVSLFNGMGGAAAALISLIEFQHLTHSDEPVNMFSGIILVILLGLFIGSVSFSGSMVAFGKLDGKVGDIRSVVLRYVNIGFIVVIFGFIAFIMSKGSVSAASVAPYVYILFVLSLIYGVFFVMPIGGADMPVVISLLNSFTGVAAALGGFLYGNQVMLTGGILVGSAGTILTVLMCNAMNRSLLNVLVGAFGGASGSVQQAEGNIKEISLSDAAVLLNYAKKVIVVPGYGLAVAHAQHLCHELEKLLENNDVQVEYAIHPVAGRMPGHMNVLLAEAEVEYDKLIEMEDANRYLPMTDVVVVVGANDVVNPAAETDPASPIYGMPIIRAQDAKNIIVMKRGMGKGYAGIENNLFFHEKTRMLFGDAKDSLQKLIAEIQSL